MSFTSNVSSGAVVTGELISSGEQYVSSGGTTSNTFIKNSGEQHVASGGTAIVTTINSSGYQYVEGGAIATTINSGGSQYVDGTATITTINSGGSQYVGGVAVSTTINSAGSQEVAFYGTAVRTIINSGGIQAVSYYGLASSTVINSNGRQYVSSGGTATSTFISSGGHQEIFSSGLTFYTIISSGARQFVSSGGIASNTYVSSGASQTVEGSAVNTYISSGARQLISGGTGTGAVIYSGGGQFVFSGGTASKSLVKSDGMMMIGSSGSATGFTISSGGTLGWGFDALLSGTSAGSAISSSTGNNSYNLYIYGGEQYVSSGQTADSTNINSGGSQFVQRGGTANNAIIRNSGHQYVSSGGAANNAVISSGGNQDTSFNGTANDTVISSGGSQHISSGGVANNILIGAGGDLCVDEGGQITGTLKVDGGHAELENASALSAMTNVEYILADASANDSLMTVSAGTSGTDLATYSLDLDNTRAGSYFLFESADLSGIAGKTFTVYCGDSSFSLTVGSTYTFINGNSISLNITDSTLDHLVAEVSGDFIAPSVPTGLTQKAAGSNAALDWADAKDNSSGIKQYNIEYSTDSLFAGATTVTSTVSSLNLALTGLTALTTCYWRVQAEDNNGNLSSWSNNSSFTATPVDTAANDYKTAKDIAVLDNWIGLDDAADCYKITLTNAAVLTLNLSGMTGDANLSLLDANGKVLKTAAAKGTADETIANQLLLTGTYYVKVAVTDGGKGTVNTNYVLGNTISYFPIDTAANDYKAAKDIAVLDNWIGFGDAADCYKITLTGAAALSLNLTGMTGDANLSLLDAGGKVLKTSATKGTASEAITNVALLSGTYYVKVAASDSGKGTAGNTNYVLGDTITYYPTDKAANDYKTAADIAVLDNWIGFGDAADCYKITLTGAAALSLNLTGMTGDTNLSLLDAGGKVLKTSATKGTANEAITNVSLLSGTYYVKVAASDSGKGTAGNTNYVLGDTITYYPTDKAANDYKTAADIATLDNWVGFGDAADCYKITLTGAAALSLNLTGMTGDANLSLLDAGGKVLKTSATKGTANEAIENVSLLAGTYYVKVADGTGVNAAAYTLANQISYFAGDTTDKAGNTIDAAKLIDGPTQTGWVGFGDSNDYYRFDLATSADGTLRLYDMAGGNADLSLCDVNGKLIKKSSNTGTLEDTLTSTLAAGTYYARVNAVSGNVDYKLDFSKKDIVSGMLAG